MMLLLKITLITDHYSILLNNYVCWYLSPPLPTVPTMAITALVTVTTSHLCTSKYWRVNEAEGRSNQ